MEVLVYPVNEDGNILKGFCPTVCEEEDAHRIANKLIADLIKFNINFECIYISPKV